MPVNKYKAEFTERSLNGEVTTAQSVHEFMSWFYDPADPSRERFNDRYLVLRDNKDFMLAKFGKQHFTTTDSARRRLYCWKFDCEQGCFWVITAPERGTSIEIYIGESDEHVFMHSLKKQICSVFELQHIDPNPVPTAGKMSRLKRTIQGLFER